jgi:hypothetical protein
MHRPDPGGHALPTGEFHYMQQKIEPIARPVLAVTLAFASATAVAQSNEELVKRLDPTDFRTRVDTRLEHQETQEGGHRQILSPRLDYAISKTTQLRIELPLHRYYPGSTGGPVQSGTGDLSVRGAWRLMRSPGFALVAGVEGNFDTASEPMLGFGKHIVAPFAFAAYDAPAINSTIFPGIQHYESVAGQADRLHVSYTQARLFILTRWPNRFYTGIENQLTVDWQRSSRVGFTIETELGRFLDKHWAVWGRPGIALLGDKLPYIYNWNFEAGVRYLFD